MRVPPKVVFCLILRYFFVKLNDLHLATTHYGNCSVVVFLRCARAKVGFYLNGEIGKFRFQNERVADDANIRASADQGYFVVFIKKIPIEIPKRGLVDNFCLFSAKAAEISGTISHPGVACMQ